ncbi:MAG: hypothetical protein HZA50_01365 [Planctomycetes bacterium]|nr:hypothetical protein [Planctomycetota bacterium]
MRTDFPEESLLDMKNTRANSLQRSVDHHQHGYVHRIIGVVVLWQHEKTIVGEGITAQIVSTVSDGFFAKREKGPVTLQWKQAGKH